MRWACGLFVVLRLSEDRSARGRFFCMRGGGGGSLAGGGGACGALVRRVFCLTGESRCSDGDVSKGRFRLRVGWGAQLGELQVGLIVGDRGGKSENAVCAAGVGGALWDRGGVGGRGVSGLCLVRRGLSGVCSLSVSLPSDSLSGSAASSYCCLTLFRTSASCCSSACVLLPHGHVAGDFFLLTEAIHFRCSDTLSEYTYEMRPMR